MKAKAYANLGVLLKHSGVSREIHLAMEPIPSRLVLPTLSAVIHVDLTDTSIHLRLRINILEPLLFICEALIVGLGAGMGRKSSEPESQFASANRCSSKLVSADILMLSNQQGKLLGTSVTMPSSVKKAQIRFKSKIFP